MGEYCKILMKGVSSVKRMREKEERYVSTQGAIMDKSKYFRVGDISLGFGR